MKKTAIILLAFLFSGTSIAQAQDAPGPAQRAIDYSPFPKQTYPDRVLFGDTHLHTTFSADAGLVGDRLTPDDAYRFAKGETVIASSGIPARLRRPLDFLAVTDHAENLGLPPAIAESNEKLLSIEWGKAIHREGSKGTIEGMTAAYDMWLEKMNALEDPSFFYASKDEVNKNSQQMSPRRVRGSADHQAPCEYPIDEDVTFK